MNKYLLFIIINYFLIINNIDKRIMLDYIFNSYKYLDIYNNSNSNLFFKLLGFRILFLFLFLIYPLIAFFKAVKNKSFKLFLFYLRHPIALFDSTLKSYNILSQKDEFKEAQYDSYWKILFYHYNYKFSKENIDLKNKNILKVLVSYNKVNSITLDKYEIQENYIQNIYTGKKQKNNLPANIINSIVEDSISIHKKVKSKFKIIELTVIVDENEYYFISGKSNPDLINIKDKNYINKSDNVINFLQNPKQ